MNRALRRRWVQIVSISAGVFVLGIVVFIGVRLLNQSHAATGVGSWSWGQSDGLSGGGTANVIAADPLNADHVTVGGDSWGIFNSTTAGDDWTPAMNGMGIAGTADIGQGDYFYAGIAYSQKYPGRLYFLNGRPGGSISEGGFGYIEGQNYHEVSSAVTGTEANGLCSDRTVRPRCTGNRVIVDYDKTSGTEYIYVAQGSGRGIDRSTDGGQTWTPLIGSLANVTGMALDASNKSIIYVGTRDSGAYKITNARTGSPSYSALSASPSRVEELATIGSNVYAAADTNGVYRLDNNGATWTKLGGSFFSNTVDWAAIGGTGNTIYVGGANVTTGKTMGKSTDGGATWKWLPGSAANVSAVNWGQTQSWWLSAGFSRVLFGCFEQGCSYESTSIAVDQFNPNIVYSSGRSGVWKSEDGGTNWRPATNHLAGTMHNHVMAGTGNSATTDDVDWNMETTDDNFGSVTMQYTATAPSWPTPSLTKTKNGHTYKLVTTVPRDFTIDGVSVADDYFRAGVVRPTDMDISADGKHIYIAQFGGGIVVGSLGTGDTTAPSVSLASDQTSVAAGTVVNLTATASDNVGVDHVEFYDGATLLKTDVSAPYKYAYDTTSLTAGVHQLTAKAYDAAGNVTTSNVINLTITTTTSIPGDVNGDGRVNAIDLSILISHDGMNYPPADFNHDGIVGAADLAILLAHWTW